MRRTVQLDPAVISTRLHLAEAEIGLGNSDEGIRQLRITEELPIPISYRIGQMMLSYARLDRSQDILRLFSRLEQRAEADVVGDATWAMGYLAMGDKEQALRDRVADL